MIYKMQAVLIVIIIILTILVLYYYVTLGQFPWNIIALKGESGEPYHIINPPDKACVDGLSMTATGAIYFPNGYYIRLPSDCDPLGKINYSKSKIVGRTAQIVGYNQAVAVPINPPQ
jgi:hypothetical protein